MHIYALNSVLMSFVNVCCNLVYVCMILMSKYSLAFAAVLAIELSDWRNGDCDIYLPLDQEKPHARTCKHALP